VETLRGLYNNSSCSLYRYKQDRYFIISSLYVSWSRLSTTFLHIVSDKAVHLIIILLCSIIVARASQNRIREKLPELARGHDENHSHSVRGRLSRIDTISRSNYHSSIPSLLSLITRPCSPMIVIRCKRSFRYAPSLRRGFSSFNAHR